MELNVVVRYSFEKKSLKAVCSVTIDNMFKCSSEISLSAFSL